jgi:hypothetical protein
MVPDMLQLMRATDTSHRSRRRVLNVIDSWVERLQVQWIRLVGRMARRERMVETRSYIPSLLMDRLI